MGQNEPTAEQRDLCFHRLYCMSMQLKTGRLRWFQKAQVIMDINNFMICNQQCMEDENHTPFSFVRIFARQLSTLEQQFDEYYQNEIQLHQRGAPAELERQFLKTLRTDFLESNKIFINTFFSGESQ